MSDFTRADQEKTYVELYKSYNADAHSSLAVERDIVLKNFTFMGAVLIFSSAGGAFKLFEEYYLFLSGFSLMIISICSRIMGIFYYYYSHLLFEKAAVVEAALLNKKDYQSLVDDLKSPRIIEFQRRSEKIRVKEILKEESALAKLNAIPAGVGFLLVILNFILKFQNIKHMLFN